MPKFMLNLWNFLKSNILEVKILYILEIFYFTSVLLLIMQSQPASIAWTVTSTAAFYHFWSYTDHPDLQIRCVVYFSLSLWDMRIYLAFDFLRTFVITHYACLIMVIQIWATKIDILFLWSLILTKRGKFAEIS